MHGIGTADCGDDTARLSRAARARMVRTEGKPLFFADWLSAVFIHYAVDPAAIQRDVPFELELVDERAYVSAVLFTMRRFRTSLCQQIGRWMLRPISDHGFLNVRTYVRVEGESGIYFLAEWLSNRLAVPLGPILFGLPYHFGRLRCSDKNGLIEGNVTTANGRRTLSYRATCERVRTYRPSLSHSLDEFLLERYTAFTSRGKRRRFFRVWHEPWPQCSIPLKVDDDTLLHATGGWRDHARFISANYSPGVHEVWMGRPQRLRCYA